jgi:hypothetical protein
MSSLFDFIWLNYQMEYVGQTGRIFNTRYKEHIHDIRINNNNSGYSNHILNNGHTYGTTADTMEIIITGREGEYSNTLEKYHIYEIRMDNMNDTYIDTHNPIFEALHEIYTRQQYTHPSPPPFPPLPSSPVHYKYGSKHTTHA